MKLSLKHFSILISLCTVLIIMYTVLRGIFIFYNKDDFDTSVPDALMLTLISGIRFDMSAILLSNLLFLLCWILPVGRLWNLKVYQQGLKWLFIGVNGFFILLNAIDIVYYPFVKKRMQREAFLFVNGEKGSEALTLLPSFLSQYWYIWLFGVFLIVILIKSYDYLTTVARTLPLKFSFNYLLIAVIIAGMSVVGMRGGLQLRPLTVIDASQSAGVNNTPYVINSTFSIIRTWSKKQLNDKPYYSDDMIQGCENPVYQLQISKDSLKEKMNIVIIMVESLSKEYLSYYGGTGHTPFLDSLMDYSMVFNNGFANARESVQGVPAVLASIPAWMDDAFIFSGYSSNKFNSIASITKPYGYTSAFFHGASTGSMGFHAFTGMAGFDMYMGREDYPEPNHFDGSWGIWDHYFLPFMADKLTRMKQPFVAAVLTLNTHHPFQVPGSYKVRFPNPEHPILNSLQYADDCLKSFFNYASRQPWYSNTLFVITADHTGPATVKERSAPDDYRIPIVLYKSDNSLKGTSDRIMSQIDIMPTVLSMTGIGQPVFSFGQSIWSDTCKKAHISYKSGIYMYVDATYCLFFDGTQTIGFYEWENDRLLTNDLKSKPGFSEVVTEIETHVKKSIQAFNSALVHNKMIPNEKNTHQ